MTTEPIVIEVPDLATDRFVLRPWRAADAESLTAAWHDVRIAAGSTPPPDRSVAAAAHWIAGWEVRRLAGLAFDLVIADPIDDGVMGEVGFGHFDTTRCAATIGWWLHEDRRGRGIASDAVTLVADWVLAGPLEHLLAEISVDNPASEAVARAAGFTPLATGVWHRPRHPGPDRSRSGP
ncbi:MAG: GNAT family N-acetyltransferase [Acidimicrobiales bacterium]